MFINVMGPGCWTLVPVWFPSWVTHLWNLRCGSLAVCVHRGTVEHKSTTQHGTSLSLRADSNFALVQYSGDLFIT